MRIRMLIHLVIAAVLLVVMFPEVSTAKRKIQGITCTVVRRLTGNQASGSINDTLATAKVGGADLGVMFNYDGRTHFVFGDTFSGLNPHIGGDHRSNTMAYSTDTNLSDGITFNGWANKYDNMAHQVIYNIGGIDNLDATKPWHFIPTGAIVADGLPYVWYMVAMNPPSNIHHGGLTRILGGPNYLQSVLIDQPSVCMPGNGNFAQMTGCYRSSNDNGNDSRVYVFGTTKGRSGGVKLARVAQAEIMDSNNYEYYVGRDSYGNPVFDDKILEDRSPIIVPGPVGEFSVMYNNYVGNYIMLYVAPYNNGYHATIRQADKPWGPWSAPVRASQNIAGWYAPFMNPTYCRNNGQTFYYTASYWNAAAKEKAVYASYLCKATLTAY